MTGDAAHAAGDVGAVVEIDVIGQIVDAPANGSARRWRRSRGPASSFSLSVAMVAWQFMQVAVGGTAARAAFSTVVWQ